MTRTPWRWRKYTVAATPARIADDLVYLVTLGFCEPRWQCRVNAWAFRNQLRLAKERAK